MELIGRVEDAFIVNGVDELRIDPRVFLTMDMKNLRITFKFKSKVFANVEHKYEGYINEHYIYINRGEYYVPVYIYELFDLHNGGDVKLEWEY